MDPWLQLLIQVPVVGILIYFVLEQGKQNALERKERTDLWIEDSRQREAQWREFLRQRDEQLLATVKEMKDSYTVSIAAIIKQLEGSDARTDALTVEVKAMHIKFAQLEQTIVLSLDQMDKSKAANARRRGTGLLKEKP